MNDNGRTLAIVRALTNALFADEAGANVNSAGALRHFLDFEFSYYEISDTLPVTTRSAVNAVIKDTKRRIGEKAPSTLPKKGSKEDIVARCEFAIVLREHCMSSFYRDADALTLKHLHWIEESLENLINNNLCDDTSEYQKVLDWTYDQIDLYSGVLNDRVTDVHMRYLIIQERLLAEMIKVGIPSLMIDSYWSTITEKYYDSASKIGIEAKTFRDILGSCDKICDEDITDEERTQMEVYLYDTSEDQSVECKNLLKILTYCQSVKESIEDNPFTDLLFMEGYGITHRDWFAYGAKFYEIIADNIDELSREEDMRALMGAQINFIYGHITLPVSGLNERDINELNSTLNIPSVCQQVFRKLLGRLSKTLSDYNTTIFHLPASTDRLLVGTA